MLNLQESDTMAVFASVDELQRVVHHVFLPPKLPQRADGDSEIALLNATSQALVALRDLLLPELPPKALDNAIALLANIQEINTVPDGRVDEVRLQKILTSLPVGRSLAANVSSQNAAVLVTRRRSDLVFEEFELSPLDGDVVQTKGRLTRTFPGRAVAVPAQVLDEADFSAMIANTLSTMCHQPAPGMQPQSLKSGVLHDELHDTTNPAMVSELFMGVLAGIGSPISVSSISKNTRDEVLWAQAAPWRRSPMWLLIRVSLQLLVSRSSDSSHTLYKEIMVFIMSYVLSSTKAHNLTPDVVYTMIAKIDRRLRKLSASGPRVLPNSVSVSIERILQKSSKYISKTWDLCQRLDSRDLQLPALSRLNFERDTSVALPALDSYIEATHKRRHESISSRFVPSSLLLQHKAGFLPTLPNGHFDCSYAAANLISFEQWVEQHLDDWVGANEEDNACERLHNLMLEYHNLAQARYSGNPEATSVMVLTMFELWVACDKVALRQCPWLSQYDPGIPTSALQNLILPLLFHMKRLSLVEDYIHARRHRSRKRTDLLFAFDSSRNFANQFFDKSDTHQALLSEIESDAETARRAKRNEFQQVRAEYKRLDTRYNAVDHKYTTRVIDPWCNPPETEQVHYSYSCQKCSYAVRRDALSIDVHEWPLPSNPDHAKTVVFELDVPSWFANWRCARLVLLQDVLKGSRPKVQPSTTCLLSSNDPHLGRWHSRRWTHRRIDLMSQVNPLVKTHYSSKSIMLLWESRVCVPNSLNYKYYDSQSGQYPGEFTFNDDAPRACTYALPCEALQRFVFRPASAPDGPEPNTVIASQDACPQNMTLEEYKDLCTLPLGHRIQWSNILLQLAMPSLDFKKPETTLFILQCAYQAGPQSEDTSPQLSVHEGPRALRSSHDFFTSEENARSLLETLTEALHRVKSNWESSQALFMFIAIAARALSLSAFSGVRKACLVFLSTARKIAMEWVSSLRDKAYEAVDHEDRTAFTAKSVEVALICTLTFDIDDHHLEAVLAGKNNASILVQASIVVQEGETTLASDQEALLAILAMRRKRLLYRAYKIIAQTPTELDDAIKKAWSAYLPSSVWIAASETADHWLTTDTLATREAASMSVHYNLLNGELLVNGLPLDQPPQAYRTHPQYLTLFGEAVVEIMPSTTPGFEFSTKREFGGFSVQLGMSDGDLIVRATKGCITYETIPSRLFEKAYPISFVEGYVHWLQVATNTIQLRPVEKPWDSTSPAVWKLSQERTQWRLWKSGSYIVGIGSLTSQRVSHVLEPLADENRIHSILQPSGNATTLLVSIPTLRLSFSLAWRSDSLVSNEFRSMAVDADQSLGTLVGLRSKIVLKHLTRDDRMVLVPESEVVTYQRENTHMSVAVLKDEIHKVHALRVDPKLGRLIDNSELGCKLFMAYLHALTSFCLVDPLTHKSGTEQALTILRSAAVRSFDQLSQKHVDMLVKIAGLSPRRCHYPPHLHVMQTVDWNMNIGFLSQHGHFITAVKTLLQQAKQAMVFSPDAQLSIPPLNGINEHLLQRDNIRSASFRVSGFGAEDHTVHRDQRYTARDRQSTSQLATRALTFSCLIFRDGLQLCSKAPTAGSLWKQMCAFDTIHGPRLSISLPNMKYDACLLQEGYNCVVQNFLALHRCLGTPIASQRHKFSIMMWLSAIACDPKAELSMLQSVAMFLKSQALAQIRAPEETSFRPHVGYTCSESALSRAVEGGLLPRSSCPEEHLTRRTNERKGDYDSRRDKAWRSARNSAVTTLVDGLAAQWPCEVPRWPDLPSTYIDVGKATSAVMPLFESWYGNRLLHQYLASIENTMSCFDHSPIESVNLAMSAPQTRPSVPGYVSEHSIFLHPAPELPAYGRTGGLTIERQTRQQSLREPLRLESVLRSLECRAGRSKYETRYVADLRESLVALASRDDDGAPSPNVTAEQLRSYLTSCTENVHKAYGVLEAAANPPGSSGGAQSTFQRPRVSPTFFLQHLSRSKLPHLNQGWRRCIVRYSRAFTAMQRAERLTKVTEKQDLINELRNLGHENWDPATDPESLLMEVESEFLIRKVQMQVAENMKLPSGGDNAVMQLNMGEGKSSVIAPIILAALADGKQLARAIIAKPQSKQMAQMLISKLGGLLDRRVYYMPISRSLKLDRTAALQISDMLHDCMSSGGVLLMQPEHILSFQLMALECYILGRDDVGRQLTSTLDFLDQNARDIVDESDENFNVRFELIYTMGTQCPIELSPDRWLLLQKVLDLVRLLAPGIAQELPQSFEHQPGKPGSFPRMRILRPDAGTLLNQRLADYICNNGIDALRVSRQPEEIRKAVYTYITKAELNTAEISAVENSLFWTETTRPPLLLIRGIVACGVLEFVLGQKRWRVNYGLAPRRMPPTQLAVPYRAKDSPSPRSEFSHPDVVIALTSLSYYYDGLSNNDLFVAMGRLMEADQSDVEYQAWVKDADALPDAFKQLQGINLKDRPLCISEVFPPLRRAKAVIDFFLAHIVFPKQMKEFPHKLSASGWDLGKRKGRPVTGFSGTNDSRCVLPTDVHHLDHPDQTHTNALVLEHILRPDNGVQLMEPASPGTSDAEHLLTTVLQLTSPVQVILDVGAQIIELTNIQVAKTWLRMHDATKEAAVFVDEHDELCVVDREGRIDLLRASSFFTRLDVCLIFLDEAHTRGIDLRLPPDYRAAVTLGAGLTKDRLVQACMRMRKLGKGQTVVFCVSREIQAKIMEYKNTTRLKDALRSSDIKVTDVILWSISETHVELRRSMPLWAVQGERFFRQEKLWQQVRQDGHTLLSKGHAEKFQEKEAQSLDDRFRPRLAQSQPLHLTNTSDADLGRIAERCQQFDELQFNSSTLQEEQERELSPEIEQEREVQKAPPAKPTRHVLHEDVRKFAMEGVFISNSKAYMPAFEALKDSSAAKNFSVCQLAGAGRLFVTADFAKTVIPSNRSSYLSDAFQRPVQWLLVTRLPFHTVHRIMIISPFEANQLYKRMQGSLAAALHVFKPRCNSGFGPMDGLGFHRISAQAGWCIVTRDVAMQLALFSGQLYIRSWKDYQEICSFLGLSTQAVTQEMGEQGWEVAADGFILSDEQGRSGGGSGLSQSPVNFLEILMSKIRRNGDGIAKTHMGSLLKGKLFRPSDFEE